MTSGKAGREQPIRHQDRLSGGPGCDPGWSNALGALSTVRGQGMGACKARPMKFRGIGLTNMPTELIFVIGVAGFLRVMIGCSNVSDLFTDSKSFGLAVSR